MVAGFLVDLLFRCVNFFVQQEIKKLISFSAFRAKEQSPKLKHHLLGALYLSACGLSNSGLAKH